MQNGCDFFARFDSYYVNGTFSKIWHFAKIDLWFDLIWTKNDLDLIWLFVILFLIWGFDLNHFCKWFVICTCDLICDLPITAFCSTGDYIWGRISSYATPARVRSEPSLSIFRRQLKTYTMSHFRNNFTKNWLLLFWCDVSRIFFTFYTGFTGWPKKVSRHHYASY